MPDIIITPSSGKLEFVDNSAQVTRRHSFTLDANNGVNFDAPLSAAAISAPLNVINVTVNNSNVNYPFVLASGSAETGTKTLMMDGAGGTYNPFTNLATIDISGNAATTTLASDSTNLGGVAAASYVTLTGTQTLTNKTITGTFTGNLTGTGSWATNAVNANTATNATQLNGQAASYYTNIPARLGYTPVNQAGDTISGNLTVNGNFAVNGSVTAFSASNIYITSSNLTVTDNILIMNALSPYQRYAGIQMYDSGSGTLSQFLWDGEGDYFFLTGSAVNGKIITGPDGQTNLTANYIPKATAGYKLGNSLIYDNGTNVGIGTTSAAQKLDVVGNIRCVPASSAWAEGLSFSMPTTSSWGGLRWRRERGSADGNHYIGYIGTDTTDDLVFGSNNGGTQIDNNIRITKAGLVGIGTSSPSYKLDVGAAGNDVVSVRLTPGYERVRYYGFDLLGYNDGNLWMIGNNPTNTLVLGKTWDWDNQIGIAYTPGTVGNSGGILQIGQISKNNANYTHGITRLYTNGLERITIIANGNVGISTTLPTTPLHVVGVISGSSFSGAGTGLTGTASSLTAGTANSVAWTNVSSRPTAVSAFTNDSLYQYHRGDITSLSSSATNVVQPLGTFDGANITNAPTSGWYNYLSSTHGSYLTSLIANLHRSADWYVGYKEGPGGTPTNPSWYKLLHSGNYTDYTVTKTGTGASGTWAITSSWATNAVTALNVGNGTITIAAGTGVGVGTTNTFTTNQSGATTVTITNTGVTSLTTNTGLSSNVSATGAVTVTNTGVTAITTNTGLSTNASATGAVTITNTGVTSNVAGTGISVSGATGAVTITNSGVTSAVAGTGVSVSGATGAVTISIGQAVGTSNSPTFAGVTSTFTGSGLILTNASTADSATFFTINGATTTERAIIIQDAGTNKWWFGRDNNGTVQTGIGFYNYGTSNFEFYITDAGTAVFRNAINGSISGNAATATTLQTARNIGGVSFNGSADINLPGVNTAGNQNTSGNAATATTASYANALNAANSYTVTNLIASGYLQSTVGYLRTDDGNGIEVLTTLNAAQAINVKGILIGSSYDTTAPQNEIRTSANQSLNLNARGTGDITLSTADGERVRLLNGGNVGIGTSSPGRKLDVEGIVRTRGASGTGGFEISAATTGTAKWRIEWDSASDSLDFNWVG